jgi:hypothetical protein
VGVWTIGRANWGRWWFEAAWFVSVSASAPRLVIEGELIRVMAGKSNNARVARVSFCRGREDVQMSMMWLVGWCVVQVKYRWVGGCLSSKSVVDCLCK